MRSGSVRHIKVLFTLEQQKMKADCAKLFFLTGSTQWGTIWFRCTEQSVTEKGHRTPTVNSCKFVGLLPALLSCGHNFSSYGVFTRELTRKGVMSFMLNPSALEFAFSPALCEVMWRKCQGCSVKAAYDDQAPVAFKHSPVLFCNKNHRIHKYY